MTTPPKNEDLHGNAPDKSPVALVLIDVINDLEFEGGRELLTTAEPAAHRIAALARQARALDIPVVYANDNFGRWRSDFQAVVDHCTGDAVVGQSVARLLRPERDDYFVLKPKHSGFYATPLDVLLRYLQVQTLILTGLTGDRCVLFTAHDAFLRDYRLIAPEDCCASIRPEDNAHALDQMRRIMDVDTTPSDKLDLAALRQGSMGRNE